MSEIPNKKVQKVKNYIPYDTETYLGRVLYFFRLVSPINLLYNEKQIKEAQMTLKTAKETDVDPETCREAFFIVKSNLHPDTQQPIFLPFRYSAFVPMNIPIAIGLCLASPITMKQSCLFQFINQSYNFGVNVCNANSTNAFDNVKEYLPNYLLAVGSSLSVTVGLLAILQKGRFRKYELIVRVLSF
jgi:hypothetical protein